MRDVAFTLGLCARKTIKLTPNMICDAIATTSNGNDSRARSTLADVWSTTHAATLTAIRQTEVRTIAKDAMPNCCRIAITDPTKRHAVNSTVTYPAISSERSI